MTEPAGSAGAVSPANRYRLPAAVAAAAGAVLFPFVAHRADSPLHGAVLLGAVVLLVSLGASDALTLRLPNVFMYPGLIAGVLLAGAWPDRGWASSLAGGAAGFGLMLALFLLLPGFGFGDVKLCALIGLLTGVPHVFTALMLGVVCNGFVALLALTLGRRGGRTAIPYGPGLIAGALLVLLVLRG